VGNDSLEDRSVSDGSAVIERGQFEMKNPLYCGDKMSVSSTKKITKAMVISFDGIDVGF
jgi:hypothetical protein